MHSSLAVFWSCLHMLQTDRGKLNSIYSTKVSITETQNEILDRFQGIKTTFPLQRSILNGALFKENNTYLPILQ